MAENEIKETEEQIAEKEVDANIEKKENSADEKIHDPKKAFALRKTMKKVWHFLWEEESIASYAIFIILAFVGLRFIFFPVFLFATGYSDVAAVVSSSMEHNSLTEHTFYNWLDFNGFNRTEIATWPYLDGLKVGDVIAVKKFPADEIQIGDVILFYSDRGQIIHRVLYIDKSGSEYAYTTKGDANTAIIDVENKVPYSQVKGKLVGQIPYIGWPKVIFSKIIPF